ncbi:MAG: PilC/PilY family type IV pilus protein [Betaproteobacteria bacterium]|nr:PilC/PilY family type IV pilus protein [Betaproteobacteria bacterium]
MNYLFSHRGASRRKLILSLAVALFPGLALSEFDIAQRPLVADKPMDPNLVYIHDDSGSMADSFLPDGAISGGVMRATPFLNGAYYNPDITYQPPVRHDGTRLVRLRNSDRITDFPRVCGNGYAEAVAKGGACSSTANLTSTATSTAVIQGTGAAPTGMAAYWDYVPGYNSMRDNVNYDPDAKPEDSMHNYEYWSFRALPTGNNALFRQNRANSGYYARSQAANQTLVRNRACPTIFREIADGREYYAGLPSSSGAYSGTLQNPVFQLAGQGPIRKGFAGFEAANGIAHAHCRDSYRVFDVDEAMVGQGYGGTTAYHTGTPLPAGAAFNLAHPRSRFCTNTSRYASISNYVLRPWEEFSTATTGTGSAVTCYAGRHAIGDTTGHGFWSATKDLPDAPVSHFEYGGQIYNTEGTGASPGSCTTPACATRCPNGVCTNLNGAEQGRLRLISRFVNDDGDVVIEETPRRRTSREEIRNFMNWYTYYRTRSMIAKGGMTIAFAQLVDWNDPSKPGTVMRGQNIRLGYDTINSGSMNQTAVTNRGPGQSGSNRGGIGVVPFRDFPSNAVNHDGTPSPYAGEKFVKRFYDWVFNLPASGGTPLHTALNTTGAYFRTNSPWKEYPPISYAAGGNGGSGEIYGCRRSFAILMTDGYASSHTQCVAPSNTPGDVDCAATLPRIEQRDSSGNLARSYQYTKQSPFCGQYAGNVVSCGLADKAMYYWATDLLPNVSNQLAPTKQNPAFWQHMQTFTIGLGVQGRLSDREVNDFLANPDRVAGRNILWTAPTGLDTAYEQVDDLMHAGLNGHGGTVEAVDAAEFADKLSALLTAIAGEDSSNTGYAGSGAKRNQENTLFTAGYNPADWSGALEAFEQKACARADEKNGRCKPGTIKDTPEWEAGQKLSERLVDGTGRTRPTELVNRKVFTWNGSEGVAFDANMPKSIKDAIDAPLDRSIADGIPLWDDCPINRPGAPDARCVLGRGSNTIDYDVDLLIDYLRGDRTWEDLGSSAFAGQSYFGFRNRRDGGVTRILGDIVNSTPYVSGNSAFNDAGYGSFTCGQGVKSQYAKDSDCNGDGGDAFFGVTHVDSYQERAAVLHARGLATNPDIRLAGSTVFVGANDGMLHAFNALDGEELFAYVPMGVHGRLKHLSDPEYNQKHHYLVDGSPFVQDILLNNEWRSVLVGHTGRGGRSFFALDVEDPANFSKDNVLWEITGNDYPDLGYPVDGEGVITPVDGLPNKWGVIFGNGYNSDRHDACLFVAELDKNPRVETICVGEGDANQPNGLGVPIWVDTDRNGAADMAYAGDALGNLWKFDLRTMTLANGGRPMLRAAAPDGGLQPISAPPLPIVLKGDGSWATLQIVLGTGKYFEQADLVDPVIQSIYGIRDLSPVASSPTAERSVLMARDYVANHPPEDMFCKNATCDRARDEDKERYKAWKILTESPDSPDYGASQMGYVIDFDAPRMKNWRVRAQGTVTNRKQGRTTHVLIPTVLPEDDPCSSAQNGGLAEINPETGGWIKTNLYKEIQRKSNVFILDGSYGMEINRDGKFDISAIKVEVADPNNPGKTIMITLNRTDNARGVTLGRQPLNNPCDQPVLASGAGQFGSGDRCEGKRAGRQSWRQLR